MARTITLDEVVEMAPSLDTAQPSSWRTLYRTAGVAALLTAAMIPIQISVFFAYPFPDTVRGYNLEAIRSFLAKKSAKAVAAAKNPGRRKKRRKGTWTQILGSPDRSAADPSGSGRAPPT